MRTEVIIQIELEGYHRYPDAPEKVKFLRDRHRHTFVIKAGIHVDHAERDREIFIERDKLRQALERNFPRGEFNEMSCESIAEWILTEIPRCNWCEVWEENTGGAKVYAK